MSRSEASPRRSWILALLVTAGVACSLPFGQQSPPGIIIEPTVRPTTGVEAGTQAPPPPTDAPAPATATGSAGDQLVLRQPFAIVLAYSGPQTGPTSALFTPLQQASQMAIDDFGPIYGFGVNLVAFDDGCSESGGQAVAQQIAADERIVAVLGPACSGAVRGAGPILEAANIVMISGAATDPGLGPQAAPRVFHRTLLDDAAIQALGHPSQIYIMDSPRVLSWYDQFVAWGGMLLEEGLNHYSAYQYDAATILLRAIGEASVWSADGSLTIDREALRQGVRGMTDFPGVTGEITFEADGDRAP
jgi:ABC-type branched-subunit amino acid transport system substrate-binding protein